MFGKLIYQSSVGKIGYTNARKRTFFAYELTLEEFAKYLKKNRIRFIFLIIKGFIRKKQRLVRKKLKFNNKFLVIKSLKLSRFNHSKGLRNKKLKRL